MKRIALWFTCSCCFIFCGAALFKLPYPSYFPEPQYDFSKNPLTQNKIQLGRFLFYDPILSRNDSISCASCHNPYSAFAHTDHALSHGIYDSIGKRNAPALFNLAWKKFFMRDGAIHHLDVQALAPISHPAEMNQDIKEVVRKLSASSWYQRKFLEAFNDKKITGERVLKALAQFQLTLVSANSRYDSMQQGLLQFNEKETRGYSLFLKYCNSCHTEPLFTSEGYVDNGLPVDSALLDYGRVLMTKQEQDSFCFAIPSLRNIAFTYPYMHDGRIATLNEVLKFYARDKSSLKDKRLKHIPKLSASERVELIAFLLTLSDKQFVFHPDNQFPKELLTKDEQ